MNGVIVNIQESRFTLRCTVAPQVITLDSLWPRTTQTHRLDLSPFHEIPAESKGVQKSPTVPLLKAIEEIVRLKYKRKFGARADSKTSNMLIPEEKPHRKYWNLALKVIFISGCLGKQCLKNTYEIKHKVLMIKCLYVNTSVQLFSISLTHGTTWKPCQPQSSRLSSQRAVYTAGTCCPSPFGAWHYHINFVNDLVICAT